jgi:hypothetical protein
LRIGRFSLVVLLGFVATMAPRAYADSYTDGTINFTVSSGNPAPTGSFVYDNTTGQFTSFTTNWDGATFGLPFGDFFNAHGGLADLPTSGYWCGQATFHMGNTFCLPVGGFTFGTVLFNGIPLPDVIAVSNSPFTNISALAYGSYTITETRVGTPEPGTLCLMLLGLVALIALLRRTNQVPQSSTT